MAGGLPAEISSTGNCPKQIMVASVSSCDEVGAFVYPLGGQLPGADGFPDRGLFDKLSWLAKTNRMNYLSQPGRGGCDSRETGFLHFDRAVLRATWS